MHNPHSETYNSYKNPYFKMGTFISPKNLY